MQVLVLYGIEINDMQKELIGVLIIEDDALSATALSAFLSKNGFWVVGIADNAIQAEQYFIAASVDVLLVDIGIKGAKDGIMLVERLMTIKQVPVVYMSGLEDHEVLGRMKNTRPVAFLSKPYSMLNVAVSLELSVERGMAVGEKTAPPNRGIAPIKPTDEKLREKEKFLVLDDFLIFKYNYQYIRVHVKHILFIEADKNFVHIGTSAKKYILRLSIQQVSNTMAGFGFVRIHRSYIINLRAIDRFSCSEVIVGGTHLPLGRNYRGELEENLRLRKFA